MVVLIFIYPNDSVLIAWNQLYSFFFKDVYYLNIDVITMRYRYNCPIKLPGLQSLVHCVE